MPSCSICFDRPFPNARALKQHLRTTTDYHPYCDVCNKNFSGLQGYDMHMSSVHPHVRGCGICNVRFRTHRDLSAHYFESNAHPACYKCNIGLKTRQDLTDHNNLLHIQFRCELCKTHVEGTLADIQSHYLISPSHPKCFIHNIGFKNDLEFAQHCAATHPEPGLVTSPLEVDVTESHDDDTLLAVTVYTASPSPSPPPEVVAAPSTSSPILGTSPPLHVSDEPNSLGEVSGEQLREENTGVEANLPRSPDFEYPTRASQPDSSYSTPLHPSSPISETSMEPPPLATIIFREDRTFVQVAPNVHCPQIDSDSSSPTSFTEVSSVDSRRITLVVAPDNGYLAVNEDYTFRIAPATPDPITPEATTPATEIDNSVTLVASPSDPLVQDNGSASIDALIHAMEVFPSPTDTVVHSPFLGESLNVPAPVSPTFSVSAESHDITLQADLEALDEPIYSPIGRRSRRVEIADDVAVAFEIPEEEEELGHAQPEGSFLSDHDAYHDAYPKSPIDDEQDLSSNVLYTPHEGRPINFGIPVQDYVPPRPRIRVSTASSSSALTSPSHSPQSDTSEFFCRSPSVSPPADLACLPSISPFELTPIDPPIYELRSRTQSLQITIPEHLNTLLHLASSLSPNVPMTDDLHTPSSLSMFSDTISEALNSGGADWSRSKEIDPLYEDSILAEQLPLPDSVASTPIDEVQSPESLPLWEQSNDDQVQSLLEYTLPSTTRRESLIPRPSISAKPEVVQAAAAPSEPVIPQPRLHCRSCERNPCVDITATMCGHIFCYGCITDAVIKTSKCPVCMTPTLLYCLFRLDLSS